MKTIGKTAGWVALIAALAFGGWACMRMGKSGNDWQSPRPVTIDGGDGVCCILPTFASYFSTNVEGQAKGLLLREGDMVLVADAMIDYRMNDGPTLLLAEAGEKSLLLLNGKVVAVTLGDDGNGLKWLNQATDADLAALRGIKIKGGLGADQRVALKRLAGLNHQIALMFADGGEKEARAVAEVLVLFSPRTLGADHLADAQVRGAVTGEKQLEDLVLTGDKDSGSLEFLSKLTHLKRLALTKWNVESTGPLPGGLRELKALTVFDSEGLKDLSPLAGLPDELEKLSLVECGLKELKGIARWTALKTLVLTGSGDKAGVDITELNNLKQLEWVGLPATVSQDQFAAFVAAHPGLRILELSKADKKLDLSPLRNLRQLEGLVLLGEYENLEIIRELKALRYVGINADTFKKSPETVKAIQNALPDALVVPVAPLCLGSGWILVLAPLVILIRWCRIGRQSRAGTGATHA